MRFKFDPRKSRSLRKNPKRGIGFEESLELWNYPHYIGYRDDDPEQHWAIGWVKGRLVSVIFEIRNDEEGEYYHLVTLWPSTKEEQKHYEENI